MPLMSCWVKTSMPEHPYRGVAPQFRQEHERLAGVGSAGNGGIFLSRYPVGKSGGGRQAARNQGFVWALSGRKRNGEIDGPLRVALAAWRADPAAGRHLGAGRTALTIRLRRYAASVG